MGYLRALHLCLAFCLGSLVSWAVHSQKDTVILMNSSQTTKQLYPLSPPVAPVAVQEQSFYEIGLQSGTDKVTGKKLLTPCLLDRSKCNPNRIEAKNPRCKITGHFYQDLYQRWLGPMSTDDTEPFAFLEIGFGMGNSVPAWRKFAPKADYHVIDVACQNLDTVSEGHRRKYKQMIAEGKLHCGSSDDFAFLHKTYTEQFKSNPAPLKVVLDDGSHIPKHMVATVWFWLPRIEPGGFLILEDIESNVTPKPIAHGIQSDFIPQLMNDVHFCGDPINPEPEPCFPSLQPLVKSVHCDLHVCLIERTEHIPSYDPPVQDSTPPSNALNRKICFDHRR